jgi:hypothetical protein
VEAWAAVKEASIRGCWRKCGILINPPVEESEENDSLDEDDFIYSDEE